MNNGKVATLVEEVQLFLKSSSNYEPPKNKNTPESEPIAGTSAQARKSTASFSGSKRKVDDDDQKDDDEDNGNVKRRKDEIHRPINLIEEGEKISAVFSNDFLLRTIFGYLNFKDLKSCRMVYPLWNLEATKILQKRGNLRAIEIIDATVKLSDVAVYKRPISLQDFQNLTSNSTVFPVQSFITGNNPMSFKTKCFLRDSEHFVESLWCKSSSNETGKFHSIHDIVLLVAHCLPNLKILKFEGYFDPQTSTVIDKAFEVAPEMKKLHTLELYDNIPHHAISMILKKAQNLQNIYIRNNCEDFWNRILNSWVNHENLNLISRLKNMRLKFSEDSLKIFQEVLKQNPRLLSIGMIYASHNRNPSLQAEVGRFLTELFEQNSESLTEILGVRALGHIPELTFPVFLNVQRLGFDCKQIPLSSRNYPPCAPLLPPGLDLTDAFPNLTTVEFHFYSESIWEGRNEPKNILPAAFSPILSVRNLKVGSASENIQESLIKMICEKFPNVTSAKFLTMLANSAYEYIWKLSELQELDLVISKTEQELFCPTRFRKPSRHELDSAFTGFSMEAVKEMRKKDLGDINLSAEEVKALRIKPSIVDLKELRKLSIRLDMRSWNNICVTFYNRGGTNCSKSLRKKGVLFDPGYGKALLQVNGSTVLSYITKRFGFDMCPQLKSNVSVEFPRFAKLDDDGNEIEDTDAIEGEVAYASESEDSDVTVESEDSDVTVESEDSDVTVEIERIDANDIEVSDSSESE